MPYYTARVHAGKGLVHTQCHIIHKTSITGFPCPAHDRKRAAEPDRRPRRPRDAGETPATAHKTHRGSLVSTLLRCRTTSNFEFDTTKSNIRKKRNAVAERAHKYALVKRAYTPPDTPLNHNPNRCLSDCMSRTLSKSLPLPSYCPRTCALPSAAHIRERSCGHEVTLCDGSAPRPAHPPTRGGCPRNASCLCRPSFVTEHAGYSRVRRVPEHISC